MALFHIISVIYSYMLIFTCSSFTITMPSDVRYKNLLINFYNQKLKKTQSRQDGSAVSGCFVGHAGGPFPCPE